MKKTFSFFDRESIRKKIQATPFDLLVIGGGITGAGIALDAASRGMKVALVEKNDFASGTSSKSTKLIHGGLRYLKQFDFWLVKEVGTERAIVHKLAPHLVVPEKMILPLIEGGTYGSWLTSIGLKIYDILASVEGDDKRKMLDKKEALEKEPLLPESILYGAGYYAEYRTDDARLTLEILKTSLNYGALCLNYAEVTDFLYCNNSVSGAIVYDKIANEQIQISANQVVNAGGPWVDDLRRLNKAHLNKRLHLTKGVHLVVPHKKLPVKQSVYFDVADGRMMFAIPRGKSTYFGTTDTFYPEDKNEVTTNLKDANYCIDAVNNMFPDISISLDDVISSWAGLRPLIFEEGKSESELSRKDEIFISDTKLISIAGGKLTGYRKMAERVVDIVAKNLEKNSNKLFKEIQTKHIVLKGGNFKNYEEVKELQDKLRRELISENLPAYTAEYLIHNYGTQTITILEKFYNTEGNSSVERLIKAEVWFTISNEMACSPSDFFMRRTGRLFFDMESVSDHKEIVIEEFKNRFNWSTKKTLEERQLLNKEIKNASSFKSYKD